jgi:sialate O-acetylesterase
VLGFEIAGADRVFHPATARVDGRDIIVQAAGVDEPVAVRYAWRNCPEANLRNGAGLPAVPFRSDDWPVSP